MKDQRSKISFDKTLLVALFPLMVVILSGMILVSSGTGATDESPANTVTLNVSPYCSIASSGEDSHSSRINAGQYIANIGTTTLTAYCNDAEGFAIYAVGFTNDIIGNNILSNEELSEEGYIHTGTATGPVGKKDESAWSMKLTAVTKLGDSDDDNAKYPPIIAGSEIDQDKAVGDPDYSIYQEIPDSYTKVAYRASTTDVPDGDIDISTEGASLTTTYASYISGNQQTGTYSGKVKYVLVHPYTEPVVIDDSTIIKPEFCTTPVPGLTYMQDIVTNIKNNILNNMEINKQYFLVDKRDNKTYCVSKLKDGNIWMTQNLDHDIKTDGSVIYDNTTTDLGWNRNLGRYQDKAWLPASSTVKSSIEDVNNGYRFKELTYYPYSYDLGDYYEGGDSGFLSTSGNPHEHIGNYYNWNAAVAINNSEDIGNGRDREWTIEGEYTTYDLVDQSICPAGWALIDPYQYDNIIMLYSFTNYYDTLPNAWHAPLFLSSRQTGYLIGQGYWTGSDFWGYGHACAIGPDHSSGTCYEPAYGVERYNFYNVRCVSR